MKFEPGKSYYQMYLDNNGYGCIKLYITYMGWNYKGHGFKKQKIYYIKDNKIELFNNSKNVYKHMLFSLIDQKEFIDFITFMKDYNKFKKNLLIKDIIE
jgi:hypothetical protein